MKQLTSSSHSQSSQSQIRTQSQSQNMSILCTSILLPIDLQYSFQPADKYKAQSEISPLPSKARHSHQEVSYSCCKFNPSGHFIPKPNQSTETCSALQEPSACKSSKCTKLTRINSRKSNSFSQKIMHKNRPKVTPAKDPSWAVCSPFHALLARMLSKQLYSCNCH